MKKPPQNPAIPAAEWENQLGELVKAQHYELHLFITGMTPRSMEALASIRQICEEHLAGQYTLEIVDIYKHPERAREEQLIAAPTLVKTLPKPQRRLVGSLSNTKRVLAGLDLSDSGLHARTVKSPQ